MNWCRITVWRTVIPWCSSVLRYGAAVSTWADCSAIHWSSASTVWLHIMTHVHSAGYSLFTVLIMAALHSRCRHYIFVRILMVTLCNRADHYIFMLWACGYFYLSFFMVALCNRADHYNFILFLLLSSFLFPRLISAVGDWMSTILPHMVWP